MVTKVLKATPDALRGRVRVSASGVPNGHIRITRTERRTPELIRGGEFDVSTGGFIREDPEPPFGFPLTYRVTAEPTVRHIQSNRILNPKAKTATTNWTVGAGRALTRDAAPVPAPPRDATTALQIGPRAQGAGGIPERTLASTAPSVFGAGRWFLSGQMKYDSPDAWLWLDVKERTWQQIKDKGTWSEVRASGSVEANQPFASLWAAVLSPTSATTVRTNLVRDARAAVQTIGAGGYGVVLGTGGTAAASWVQGGGPTVATPNFWRVTWSVATTAPSGGVYVGTTGNAANNYAIPVTAGQPYTSSASVRTSKAQRVALTCMFYDAAGAVLGSTLVGTASVLAANTWTALSVAGTAPANAVRMIVTASAVAGTSAANWAPGDTIDMTRTLVEQTAVTAPGTFFDGDSVDTLAAPSSTTYDWAGAQYHSASTEAATSGVVLAPFQVIGASVLAQGSWLTFQAWVDVPVGVPANSKLVFLHGSAIREFATTFWLTTIMLTPEVEMTAGALPYFDGDTVLPVNPATNLVPGYDWFPVINDASIVWSGTDGNSTSIFTGPSVIAAEDVTMIDSPLTTVLLPKIKKPVLLSDPVVPQLSQWFELLAIGPLTRAARADLYNVIGRGPQIAVSQKRAWASGEFRLMTRTLEEESIADRLFDSGRILFFRNPSPMRAESSWYLHIGDVTWSGVGDQFADKSERIWSIPFVRVERPVGLIAASGSITWADIKAGYTWDELRTKREDWLDAALTSP